MSIVQFIIDHQVVFMGLGVAILDLAFALSPGLEANGVLHQIYLFLKPKPPQA